MSEHIHNKWLIILTFLLAFALDVLPLPGWSIWFRPLWTLMVMIYWVMAFPNLINVGSAFVVGLVLDLLQGTVLGEHAIAMVIVAYFVVQLYRFMRVAPLLQQTFFAFILIFIYQLLIYILQGIVGSLPSTWLYWLPVLTSIILWPWIFVLLRDSRRRAGLIVKG
ncbi:MAG: rod shape-determining protein MreD [Pseudomonadota bacterium]